MGYVFRAAEQVASDSPGCSERLRVDSPSSATPARVAQDTGPTARGRSAQELIDFPDRRCHAFFMLLVHATTVEINGQGVLIRGPSGSGKSDLAIRLIDGGARLVSDDQTELCPGEGGVVARAPEAIAGLLEVRGLGIVTLPHRASAPLVLVIDLVAEEVIERIPAPDSVEFLDHRVRRLTLAPFQASAAAKVRLAMLSATRDIMRS